MRLSGLDNWLEPPDEEEPCPDCGEEMDSGECVECGFNAEREPDREPDDGSDSLEVAAAEWGGIDYP
jgi:hypothetical protein